MADKRNLTEYAIANLKLEHDQKTREVYDTKIPAFCVRLTSTGRRTFILSGRIRGAEAVKRYTLGQFVMAASYAGDERTFDPMAETPFLTLALARKKATAFLDAMTQGEDPIRAGKVKRQRAKAHSFGSTVEAFLTAKDPDGKGADKLRPRVFYDYARRLRGPDFAEWMDRPIASITRADVREAMRAIEDRSSSANAHLSFAILRSLFNWTRDQDIIETTPTAEMKAPKKAASRDRVLSDLELKIVLECMPTADRNFSIPYGLLALTAARESEIVGLLASEVHDLDSDAPFISIARGRAKTKTKYFIPLTGAAVDLMRAAFKAKMATSDFVFSNTGETPISGLSKAKARLDAKIADRLAELKKEAAARKDKAMTERLNRCFVETWRIHDLRRTAATGMAALKIPPHIIEAALNHAGETKRGVAGVYNRHSYEEEVRHALAQWGAYVTNIVNPSSSRANVIPFGR